jgi:hypothetical protein
MQTDTHDEANNCFSQCYESAQKWLVKNNVGGCGLHLNGSEQGQVAGSWENGSENLSFIKGENFLII